MEVEKHDKGTQTETQAVVYPPSLKKKGLERKEFEKLLESKMEKLFESDNLASFVKRSIENAKKTFAIRETETGKLDQRPSANQSMEDQGLLPADQPETGPSHLQEQTREQGCRNPRKAVRKGYHRMQDLLFQELKKQNKLNSGHSNGYLFRENGIECTTKEMCNILDGITREYIEEYQAGPAQGLGETRTKKEIRKSLRDIFELCGLIVMERIFVDWAVGNDIMEKNGYKQWNEHVLVLMSFAALLVVTDVLSKTPKYGPKSFLKEGLPSTLTGERLTLFRLFPRRN